MEALAALGGLPRAALHSQLSAAFHVVLHMRRERDGSRRLTDIGVLDRDRDIVRVTHDRPRLKALLAERGVTAPW